MSRLGRLIRTARRAGAAGRRDRSASAVYLPPPGAGPDEPADTASPVTGSSPFVRYAPDHDGAPDPGEVVWAWIPYEDEPTRGKDRPVLVIGRDAGLLLALQLSSQDHDLDADDEARYGRHWMDIGSGAWDSQHRPSEVRLDRLIRLAEHDVRREGALLDRAVFDAVIRAARSFHDL